MAVSRNVRRVDERGYTRGRCVDATTRIEHIECHRRSLAQITADQEVTNPGKPTHIDGPCNRVRGLRSASCNDDVTIHQAFAQVAAHDGQPA